MALGGAFDKEMAGKYDRPLVDSHMRHVAPGRTESRFERGPGSRNRLRHATVTSRSGTLALAGSCERLGPSVISIVPRRVPERERRAAVVRGWLRRRLLRRRLVGHRHRERRRRQCRSRCKWRARQHGRERYGGGRGQQADGSRRCLSLHGSNPPGCGLRSAWLLQRRRTPDRGFCRRPGAWPVRVIER